MHVIIHKILNGCDCSLYIIVYLLLVFTCVYLYYYEVFITIISGMIPKTMFTSIFLNYSSHIGICSKTRYT